MVDKEMHADQLRDDTKELITDMDRLGMLADLNENELLNDDAYDIVTETVLKRAISRASNGGEAVKLKEVYHNVT